MPLYIKKSLEELMNIAQQRALSVILPGGCSIALTPGSVSRLLLAIVNSTFEDYYSKLEEVHIQSFLSSATGEFLDAIGLLVDCERGSATDDQYRYNISKQTTRLESSNMLAIRMALLSVEGVQEVVLRQFTHGTGSFSAFIITEDPIPSEGIISACDIAIADGVVAYGTKYDISGPDLVPIEVSIKLIIKGSGEKNTAIKEEVKQNLKNYINSLKIGETLIVNEIIEKVMSTSAEIFDMEIYQFKVDGIKVLTTNQSCRYHERFIESTIPDAIVVM